MRELKGIDLAKLKLTPENLGGLVRMIESGGLSGKIAKSIFSEMVSSGKPPAEIIKTKNLGRITDRESIRAIIEKVLSENEDNVNLYIKGKTGLMKYFIGLVMKEIGGAADPKLTAGLIDQALERRRQDNA